MVNLEIAVNISEMHSLFPKYPPISSRERRIHSRAEIPALSRPDHLYHISVDRLCAQLSRKTPQRFEIERFDLIVLLLCALVCGAVTAQESQVAMPETEGGEAPPPALELDEDRDAAAPPAVDDPPHAAANADDQDLGNAPGEAAPPLDPEGLDAVNALYTGRTANAAATTPEDTTARAEPDERAEGFGPVLQVFSALAILCGIIVLLGYLVRTLGRRTPLLAGQRYGTVLGRVGLTPRASLHFVRAADRVLVVGVTQQSVTLISEFPQEAFAAGQYRQCEKHECGRVQSNHSAR